MPQPANIYESRQVALQQTACIPFEPPPGASPVAAGKEESEYANKLP